MKINSTCKGCGKPITDPWFNGIVGGEDAGTYHSQCLPKPPDFKTRATWAKKGQLLSPEEKAEEMNKIWASVEKRNADTVTIPRDQLKDIYRALVELTKLGQTNIFEWDSTPKEVIDLRLQVFHLAEFPAMFAGQWLAQEDREDVYARVKKEAREKYE